MTDAGLKFLQDVKTLKIVDLTGTKTTAAGIADLEKAIKDLRGRHDPASLVPGAPAKVP